MLFLRCSFVVPPFSFSRTSLHSQIPTFSRYRIGHNPIHLPRIWQFLALVHILDICQCVWRPYVSFGRWWWWYVVSLTCCFALWRGSGCSCFLSLLPSLLENYWLNGFCNLSTLITGNATEAEKKAKKKAAKKEKAQKEKELKEKEKEGSCSLRSVTCFDQHLSLPLPHYS